MESEKSVFPTSKTPLTFATILRRSIVLSVCVLALDRFITNPNNFVRIREYEDAPASYEKGFCGSADNGIIFSDAGVGGSDLYKWDAQTHSSHRIVPTPYAESHPDLSPDGRQVICEYRDSDSSGLLLIDLQTKSYKKITQNQSGTDRLPTFSPDGKRILFVRSKGQIYEEIFEFDLKKGSTKHLAPSRKPQLTSLHYLSDNEICYSGQEDFSCYIPFMNFTGRFRLGNKLQETMQPSQISLQIAGVSPEEKKFYAVTATKKLYAAKPAAASEDSFIVSGKLEDLDSPKRWTFTKIVASDAKLAKHRREILFLNSDSKGKEVVSGLSLVDGKVRTYVRFDSSRH